MALAMLVKKNWQRIEAWELGACSVQERNLIREQKILCYGTMFEIYNSQNRLFPKFAKNGDFFKMDEDENPIPMQREKFIKEHRHVSGDIWEEAPKPILAWVPSKEIPGEIKFLIDNKGLTIQPENQEQYFKLRMKDEIYIVAPADTFIVFNRVSRDENGTITDVDFDFLSGSEFKKEYNYYTQP